MKAKAPNGNNRTYRSMTSMDCTVAEVCQMRCIPMMTIFSVTVSAPMTEAAALAYMQKDMIEEVLAPNTCLVKCEAKVIAA